MKSTITLIAISIVLLSTSCKGEVIKNSSGNNQHTNDLINETSSYLLQHANNPVNWKPWNESSLALAQSENKLIVVSVGYSACHWCHVMEAESFENDSVAKLMNDNFISIKVDREERPDVNQVYMDAVQLMTGSGGWPLNCITLPDGRPVFGGTYFTKKQWIKILKDVSKLYRENPEKMIAYAEKLTEGVKNSELVTLNTEALLFNTEKLKPVMDLWQTHLDYKYGGQKKAPKFPMPNNLNVLLRYSFHSQNPRLKDYVMTTLTRMSNGGLYDHIGGGFSRYSVDEKWHIPHFEKMLYDNAQLISVYSDAYLVSKNENFKTIVKETLQFIESELTDVNGGFYSSLNADSKTNNGKLEEGAFYSWTEEELKELLSADFDLFRNYFNINSRGKWENNKYILFKTTDGEEFIKSKNLTLEELESKIKLWKTKLFNARQLREKPRMDDKILTSWNGLMLKAYVDAYRAFDEKKYLKIAIKNANFIKNQQMAKDGSLYHNFKNGKSTVRGFSEDYATIIEAYIALYEVSMDEQWLNLANKLMTYTLAHFFDEASGMFYFTPDKETPLISRKMEVIDKAIPSSNSILAKSLFKLSHYYANADYAAKAKQMLTNLSHNIEKTPTGYSNWLDLYLNYAYPYYEVAVSGNEAKQKIKEFSYYYLPHILITGSATKSTLPLLENRYNEEGTYIYVCVNSVCKLPEKHVEDALEQLKFK